MAKKATIIAGIVATGLGAGALILKIKKSLTMTAEKLRAYKEQRDEKKAIEDKANMIEAEKAKAKEAEKVKEKEKTEETKAIEEERKAIEEERKAIEEERKAIEEEKKTDAEKKTEESK